MYENIYQQIEAFETDFENKPVRIVDGYEFDQLATIKTIARHYSGIYENGDEDEYGKKYFFKIGKPRCKNATKNLDLDTKDINIRAKKAEDEMKAWIMRYDAAEWARKRKLGVLINDIVRKLPKWGTVIAKRVPNKKIFELVDLRNLRNDPTADDIKNTWVIENHYYMPTELMAKKDVWDAKAIEKAISDFKQNRKENYVGSNETTNDAKGNAQYILVKEFYGEVPQHWITGSEKESEDYVWAQYIVVMPEGGSKGSQEGETKKGITLHKAKVKRFDENDDRDLLYKMCRYDKEEGRLLGVGIIEDLADMQILKNKEGNLIIQALELMNLIIFYTSNNQIAKNILTDVMNGEILRSREPIQRLSTELRGAGVDQMISQEIEQMANSLANSFEVTTGATLPSGTPFRLGGLLNQNANKLFDFIREDLGLFLQEIYEDWVLPELEKDLSKKHILEITGRAQVEKIAEYLKKQRIWKAIKKMMIEEGREPTTAEIEMAEQLLDKQFTGKESVYLDIPKDFYKNMDKDIEVIVTGERIDKAARLESLATIMQAYQANPAIFENPVFKNLLNESGFSSLDFAEMKKEAGPEEQGALDQIMKQIGAPSGAPGGMPGGAPAPAKPMPAA